MHAYICIRSLSGGDEARRIDNIIPSSYNWYYRLCFLWFLFLILKVIYNSITFKIKIRVINLYFMIHLVDFLTFQQVYCISKSLKKFFSRVLCPSFSFPVLGMVNKKKPSRYLTHPLSCFLWHPCNVGEVKKEARAAAMEELTILWGTTMLGTLDRPSS